MSAFEQTITVIIHTKNSEETLARTLTSVNWASEVLVVDMKSTDETVKIARSHKARVESVPDYGYVEPARNKAIEMAKSGWICIVDSDEVIPTELAEKLQHLAQGDATADAYWIARKNIVFGGWLYSAGWWPDYQLRFFKKGSVHWSDKIHSVPQVDGTVDYLAATKQLAIEHFNYPNVASFLDRLNRYTTHEIKDRKSVAVTPDTLIQAWSGELFARLFVHKGIEGGTRGVGISWLQAMYELVVQLKMWELTQDSSIKSQDTDQDQLATSLKALQQVSSDLRYWIADYQVRQHTGLKQLYWRVRRSLKV